MIYGYARVSTAGQAKDGNSLEAQNNALKAAGAQMIYSDHFTGKSMARPELDKLLTVLRAAKNTHCMAGKGAAAIMLCTNQAAPGTLTEYNVHHVLSLRSIYL